MKIEPVACYAAHRITPEGTTEFFGYADKPLEPATMFYTINQMRQLGEACAAVCERTPKMQAYGNNRAVQDECASEIRELIKELL